MSVLFFHTMRYRYDDPRNFNNDRFILSKVRLSHSVLLYFVCVWPYSWITWDDKDNMDSWLAFFLAQGHAAPALYSMWVEAGFLKENELLSLCHVDSTLEGHPTTVSHCPIPCESSDVAQIYTVFTMFGCVVHISEAALCGFSNWLFGAGSWCGLWNGLHWEILWQVQVIFCFFGSTEN